MHYYLSKHICLGFSSFGGNGLALGEEADFEASAAADLPSQNLIRSTTYPAIAGKLHLIPTLRETANFL